MRIKATAALAVATALTLPMLAATGAQASTTRDGCTVTPLAPTVHPTLHSSGKKIIVYPFTASCSGGRTLDVRQMAYERDAGFAGDVGGNDLVKDYSKSFTFNGAGAISWKLYWTLPNTDDTDTTEEVFHQIRFRVRSNGVTGSVTPFELSSVRSVTH